MEFDTLFGHDAEYWNHKVRTFLHDPPDKALCIQGHEERANKLLEALGIQSSLEASEYKKADIIASGMDRTQLPGYSRQEDKNGAIDFCQHPVLTHPTGHVPPLELNLPASDGRQFVREVSEEIRELVCKDLGRFTDGQGLSEKGLYKNREKAFSVARFHYLFFLLRERLAQENVGGLGGLWQRLPADTRLPDHSIWQHAGLVSALSSCFRLSGQEQASLMVFALTPVQDFVGRARKLRDYWTGSILLSWLAFEGIRAVIQELGPDHVLYPSLHGQPLIHDLLRRWQMDELLGPRPGSGASASFPNKFVFLAPRGREQELADRLMMHIGKQWRDLGDTILATLEKVIKRKDDYLRDQFERQVDNYWQYHWAACPLVNSNTLAQAAH